MNKLYVGIIVFLLLGALMIKCSLDTDFSETDDRRTFLQAMALWFKQIGISTKNTAEYAVKEQDWLPNNETVESAKEDTNNQENSTNQEDINDNYNQGNQEEPEPTEEN